MSPEYRLAFAVLQHAIETGAERAEIRSLWRMVDAILDRDRLMETNAHEEG